MEMNDILSGLNSCDDNCCDNNCCCGGVGSNPGLAGGAPYGIGGPGGYGGLGGLGGFCNCGLGSWIWILLILFYCGGCGYGNNYGNNNNGCCMNNCCCDCCDDCCCNNCCCNNSYGNNNRNCGGLLGNCSCYLFLLVVLFLCNGNFGNFGNFGNLGFLGNGYGGSACGGCGGFGGPGYGFGGSAPIANGLNCCESNCSC